MRTWPALEIPQTDTDDLIQAFLIDFNLAAVEGPRFFFHTQSDRDHAITALRARFADIDARPIDVPDEDWAERSQAALRAVTVGSLTIAPPWDVPPDSSSRIPNPQSRIPEVIVIQPSMGFGTGHHATTRLCLAALQRIDLHGRSVIDVGTGSAVLAIAARRLGASGVLAIDDDPDAIAAAEANVVLNRESRIALETGDFRSSKIGQFDVVVANLTGGLLIASANRLTSFAIPEGHLIISGFLDDEAVDVLSAFGGCEVESRTQNGEWMCVVLRGLRGSRA
jgi:ribosomal protein L11 methyltransferase